LLAIAARILRSRTLNTNVQAHMAPASSGPGTMRTPNRWKRYQKTPLM
jgi:hypothetical protein